MDCSSASIIIYPLFPQIPFGKLNSAADQIGDGVGQTGAFGAVAVFADALEVASGVVAAVFLGDNMVDVHISFSKMSAAFFAHVPAVIGVHVFEGSVPIAAIVVGFFAHGFFE